MKTKMWAILLMVFVTLFTSSAQVFYKFGVAKLKFNLIALITNYSLIIGMVLYIFGAVLMIIALRGGEVTVLYPIVATSYIWVSIMATIFFNESMNTLKWLGVFGIVAGIILISIGSNKKSVLRHTEVV